MPRKDDRRIQRTRKLLRESMLALILEQGYDDISIQDVTDRANLGRATFYLHYREKDDLLADVMQLFFEQFVSTAPPVVSSKSKVIDLRRIQQLFDFAESHYDFFRIMMIGKGSMTSSRYLHKSIREGYRHEFDRLFEQFNIKPSISRDFLENYYAGALISLIFWWLDNEMPFTSAEMAEMYMKVSAQTSMMVMPGVSGGIAPLYIDLREGLTQRQELSNGQREPSNLPGKRGKPRTAKHDAASDMTELPRD